MAFQNLYVKSNKIPYVTEVLFVCFIFNKICNIFEIVFNFNYTEVIAKALENIVK